MSLFPDAPCKRLFIDYRGLQTLGHWMTELRGQNDLELNLMESVEDVLAVLNIPDKQVLNETGLWQTISKLAAGAVVEAIDEVCLITKKYLLRGDMNLIYDNICRIF